MAAKGTTRIALIGSGFIADVHLQVLRCVRGVAVTALCDTVPERAQRLAKRYGVGRTFASVEELLEARVCDAVHVLVPPQLHSTVALQCLERGVHVLVEKPMALEASELDAMERAAKKHGAVLGVNHNQTCHPAVVRLCDHVAAGRLGRLEHVALVHNVPLRQLATGDVGHFMFQTEGNILFEQGVHLFSVVHRLLGDCRHVDAVVAPARTLGNGARFFDDWQLSLRCDRGTASVRMAFGRPLLESTLHAVGTDGAAFVDLQRGACWLRRKTRWLEPLDHGRNLLSGAVHLLSRASASTLGYGLSLFGLRFPDDPFLRSMRGSLAEFHAAVRAGTAPPSGAPAALAVLRTCTMSAAAAGASMRPLPAAALREPGPARPGEVVVLGGTGFLGASCVQLLRAQKKPLTLVVRRPQLLPPALRAADLRVFAGDAADAEVLQAAFAGADCVLHLATVAGDDADQVETAMAAAVRTAVDAAKAAGVRRLVYASSTAALWLGDSEPVTGAVPPDPQPAQRAAYARGKIAAERELAAARGAGPEIVVVRPAIVLGPGRTEHSGIGLWVRDNHCIGWGRGRQPLPLLLADDCAQALVAALTAPAAAGRSYNLAGPVRPTARELVREIASRTGRDIQFHGAPIRWLWLQELGKHAIKWLARRPRALPSLRDLRSRSFRAPLDCSDAERDLGFRPEADAQRFLQRLFGPAASGAVPRPPQEAGKPGSEVASPAAGASMAGTPAAAPAAGTPATGTPAAGTSTAGTPATGTPGTGTPGAGTPGAGTPGAGTPATGKPGPAAKR